MLFEMSRRKLIAVATWPDACIVLCCTDTGIMGSTLTYGMDVCVHLSCPVWVEAF
jgi:hypothetical protein